MNILIVDDHPLTGQGLAALLLANTAGARVECVHRVAEARERLRAPTPPDWVFLDIQLPDDPRRTLLDELRDGPLAARTILMSALANLPVIRAAIASGVRGFIPKSADPAMVLEGFACIRRGQIYLPAALSGLMADPAGNHAEVRSLSPRLAEIQLHVLRGAPNKVIARDLGLSEHTVKEYISSILAFHSVRNRLELVLKLQGPPAPDDPLDTV
jgi:two-component system, NarL family, nitrate/nitrite response regulator NarL